MIRYRTFLSRVCMHPNLEKRDSIEASGADAAEGETATCECV